MSWMQKLYETYESCAGNKNIPDSGDLFPVSHSTQQAHIEIVIDHSGNFKTAKVIENKTIKKHLYLVRKNHQVDPGKSQRITPFVINFNMLQVIFQILEER